MSETILALEGLSKTYASGLKALDYSRRSIEERWAAGERDMAAALDRVAALGPPRPGLEGIRC